MASPDFSALRDNLKGQLSALQKKRDVASAVRQSLEEVKDRLTYWEKDYIAQAINALAMNIRSVDDPAVAWLHLAIVNAEQALIPPAERNGSYSDRSGMVDSLTYLDLMEEIELLASEIEFGGPR